MKFSKDELRLVARSKGWTGGRASKDDVLTWLNSRGVAFADIAKVVGDMRRSARGVQPAVGAPAAPSVSKAEIDEMVTNALKTIGTGSATDEKTIRRLVAEEISKQSPARVVIDGTSKPVLLKERTHPIFEKVLRCVRAGMNVLLVGPAGCGKSFLSKQVAKALNRSFGTLHCSAGVSESQVTGWLLPVGKGGSFEFVASQFANLYVKGKSVFLIDEIDAADPNMLTVLNGALANGTLHIPQCAKQPEWHRGEDTAIIAAANTYGQGADMLYVGRNQLDAATLDRFYVIQMDYDAALEHDTAGLSHTPAEAWKAAAKPTADELQQIGTWVLHIRAMAAASKLRRVVSTRTIQKAITARKAGIPLSEIKRDVLAGWSRDELAKVGEG